MVRWPKCEEIMKKKNGIEYKTVDDASKELGIAIATVRRYIRNGTFPAPPKEFFGSVGYSVFPDDYLADAAKKLKRMRGED